LINEPELKTITKTTVVVIPTPMSQCVLIYKQVTKCGDVLYTTEMS